MRLAEFDSCAFERGRSAFVEMLWIALQAIFVSSWLPGSFQRKILMRMFGAKIGKRCVIKPYVRVKFPWRLDVGDDVWIGEGVWIDNLDMVSIDSDVCLSQGVYLCTGSHDWRAEDFKLVLGSIKINNSSWLGAQSSVGPGVTVGSGVVLTLGSVATGDLNAWSIYSGNPARYVRDRNVRVTSC